jgi:quercetin dioxygenase-like cupin family protein
MAAARNDLKRTGMPAGVEQWQLPVTLPLENVLVFISRLKPGATVPLHAHNVWVFRVIISGSLVYGRKTLKAGDWMLVPPGEEYAFTAGKDGCTIFYAHCMVRNPPIGPTPGPKRPTSG